MRLTFGAMKENNWAGTAAYPYCLYCITHMWHVEGPLQPATRPHLLDTGLKKQQAFASV